MDPKLYELGTNFQNTHSHEFKWETHSTFHHPMLADARRLVPASHRSLELPTNLTLASSTVVKCPAARLQQVTERSREMGNTSFSFLAKRVVTFAKS